MAEKKIKICLNSNLTDPEIVENLLKKYKVQLANPKAEDIEIIKWADKEDYHIITRNTRHYKQLFRGLPMIKIGVIAINTAETHKILLKLDWLLSNKVSYHEALYNRFYEIDLQGFLAIDKEGNSIISKTSWPN